MALAIMKLTAVSYTSSRELLNTAYKIKRSSLQFHFIRRLRFYHFIPWLTTCLQLVHHRRVHIQQLAVCETRLRILKANHSYRECDRDRTCLLRSWFFPAETFLHFKDVEIFCLRDRLQLRWNFYVTLRIRVLRWPHKPRRALYDVCWIGLTVVSTQ